VVGVEIQETGGTTSLAIAGLDHVRKVGQTAPLMTPTAAATPKPTTQPVVVANPGTPGSTPAAAGPAATVLTGEQRIPGTYKCPQGSLSDVYTSTLYEPESNHKVQFTRTITKVKPDLDMFGSPLPRTTHLRAEGNMVAGWRQAFHEAGRDRGVGAADPGRRSGDATGRGRRRI
jgi:hypothetical protein